MGMMFLACVASHGAACPEKDWQLYTDHVYRLTLCIPPGWRRPTQIYADRPYFEGPDGHFQFDASEGDTPEQVCQGAATHHLHPYGSHPQIRSMKIQGQKVCVVWPSEDQRAVLGRDAPAEAELVVQYPRPVKIVTVLEQPSPVKKVEGIYGQLVMTADEKHILEIAKSLRFQVSK
jgi:hypothetical protein